MSIPKLIAAVILYLCAGICAIISLISLVDWIADGITLFTEPGKTLAIAATTGIILVASSLYVGFKSIGEGH